MSRESARRRQRDDPRIVGTFEERILFHSMAAAVLCRLPELHRDVAVDWGSFEHITLAFLRERDAAPMFSGDVEMVRREETRLPLPAFGIPEMASILAWRFHAYIGVSTPMEASGPWPRVLSEIRRWCAT